MKIAVKDIESNPYRHMDKYPIDVTKVEALKNSITEKTFWDNILARKHGDKYQLAYGHHRWIALKELGIKEIDIPIRRIDDATMIQIMAEENLNWSTSPAVMTQTILVAKEFLENYIADTPCLNKAGDFASSLWTDEVAFKKAKTDKCVGRDVLVKFLGGNWTGHKVRIALDIIKDKELSQPAINVIPTMEQARVFRTAVKQHEIPKPIQREIAKTIVKEGVGRRDIPDLVAKHSKGTPKKKLVTNDAEKIKRMVDDIESGASALRRKIQGLRTELRRLDVIELKGLKTFLAMSALRLLIKECGQIEGRN